MKNPRTFAAATLLAVAMLSGCGADTTPAEVETAGVKTTASGSASPSRPESPSSIPVEPTTSSSTAEETSSPAATESSDEGAGIPDPGEAELEFTGLGPLQIGMSMQDLTDAGFLVYPDECGTYGETDSLKDLGVEVGDLNTGALVEVSIVKAGVQSVDGAEVGMTLAELKEIFDTRLSVEGKLDQAAGSQVNVAVVESKGNELVFAFDVGEAVTPTDTDVVNRMVARKISPDFTLDGC